MPPSLFSHCANQLPVTPSKSSTFERTLPGAFNISYVNEDPITGDLISETFRIGDATITGQMLALANNGSNLDGVLGLGYTLIESTNQGPNPFTYPTVVDQLFDQGKINLKAYSLFLDSRDAKTGSIIFGGMDTDKYIGDLVQVPMAPRVSPQGDPVFDSLAIYLNHLKITNGTQTTNLTASALHEHVSLDSGSSLSYLPNDVAKTLFKALGAVDDTKLTHGPDASGGVFVNCSLKTSSLTIDYIFGDSETEAKIRVPISDIIYTSAEMLGEEYRYNTSSCVLGINPSISGMSLLGGTFLKSAYVVYDLSNNVMGLAQMNPDSTTEKIVDFKESDITIPGASKIASLVHPAETTTFYGGLENISSGTRIRMLSTTSTGTSTGTTAPTGVAAVPTQDSDAAPTASPSVTSSPAPRNSGERITATSGIIVGFAVSMATFLLSSGWLFI